MSVRSQIHSRLSVTSILDRQARRLIIAGEIFLDQGLRHPAVAAPALAVDEAGVDNQELWDLGLGCLGGDAVGYFFGVVRCHYSMR